MEHNPDDIEEISGVVENIVFRSEETGYTVCRVRVEGKDEITVVGSCAALWSGETLKAVGRWVRHKRHGFQFNASTISCVAPTSKEGIERYLASGTIRGSGKVMAERIVRKFGADTLKVIENESARLLEVEGIGPVRRQMIKDSWNEQKAVRDIMVFLHSHGVGTAKSARIFRRYGQDAVALITENPYRLCRDVWGIGFKTADGVAASLGIPPHSDIRARAGIIHVLQTMSDDGHCFCPTGDLIAQAQALLDIPNEILKSALQHETARGRLICEGENIYMASLHEAEVGIAMKLAELLNTPPSFQPIVVEKAVPWAQKKMRIEFAEMQVAALKMALSEKVSIITGGPGVGKTTIIRALVDVFAARKIPTALAAPTGRAAKRMEEATGHKAKTIHRLLKYNPKTGDFEHGPGKPVEADAVILDEVSMIDVPLMHVFLRALAGQTCLILVGDTDQLPSVGPGNALRDLINSGTVPCAKLETIFRQKSGGWIVQNAHRVNRGEFIQAPDAGEPSDFYFIEASTPEEVIERMLALVVERVPARFGFDPITDIQVLTPMRRNQLGSENLNAILQEALNPSGRDIQRFGRSYRLGDRVMQICNNYEKEVFNGDVGRIADVNIEEQCLTVDFDGRGVAYDIEELDELTHAYACSIHKAQGSEYPAVIVLIATQHYKLLQRNLLYTALTRGKKLLCLIGSHKAIHIAIRNNEIRYRRTGLKDRLMRGGVTAAFGS